MNALPDVRAPEGEESLLSRVACTDGVIETGEGEGEGVEKGEGGEKGTVDGETDVLFALDGGVRKSVVVLGVGVATVIAASFCC